MTPSSSSRPKPEVTLTTIILPEHDPALSSARLRAFANDSISLRYFPPHLRPSKEQELEWKIYQRAKRASQPQGDQLEVMAVVDGKPVGYATWLGPVDRTSTGGDPLQHEKEEEEREKQREKEEGKPQIEKDIDAATDLVFEKAFMGEMDRVRKEWSLGRPHWYLKFLAVDPDVHGLGIGSQLLNWGMKQAAAEGLPCFLEATESGRLLYERRGWKVVNWCEIPDETRGPLRFPGMKAGDFVDADR